MKIILTGTYYSGKTTIIKKYKNNKNINIMGELVRSLSLEPNFYFKSDKVNNYAFSEFSLAYLYYGMAKVQHLLDNNKPWLFDRCIVDVLYYLKYFELDSNFYINNHLYEQVLSLVTELSADGYFSDTTFLLLKPIKIKENDNFRMQGQKDQIGIYNIAKIILEDLKLSFYEKYAYQALEYIENIINNNIQNK